jgi:hypothetical protein
MRKILTSALALLVIGHAAASLVQDEVQSLAETDTSTEKINWWNEHNCLRCVTSHLNWRSDEKTCSDQPFLDCEPKV